MEAIAGMVVVVGSLADVGLLPLGGWIEEVATTGWQTIAPLAHPLRRTILTRLLERPVWTRDELAESLVADESVPHDDFTRLELVLHHHHLPKLDASQYVEYDRRNGDVVLWKDDQCVQGELDCQ